MTNARHSATPLPLHSPRHKRREVAEELRSLIGGLASGDRLPSVAHLEKHFGVAKSTVELAVNDLREEGLLLRRRGSGTFVAEAPKEPGSALFSSRERSFVLQSHWGSSTMFGQMIPAAEEEAMRLQFRLLVRATSSPRLHAERLQKEWEAGRISGFIHVGSLVEEEAAALPPIPGVIIGELPESYPIHQVVVDNYAAGRRVAEYLWRLGHRRFAYVSGSDRRMATLRRDGFRDALLARTEDAPAYREVFLPWTGSTASQDIRALDSALQTLLGMERPPTALFFSQDAVALPALDSLREMGVAVPETVSVVGFDDVFPFSAYSRPALTSVRMPNTSLAALAVQLLAEASENPALPPRALRLPAELTVRDSAGPCLL